MKQPVRRKSSALIRTVFAAAAVLATVGIGSFIDTLARGYGAGWQAVATAPAVTVARR
jgi:hypothetical protein